VLPVATEGGDAPTVDPAGASDADVVITTVVSADDARSPAREFESPPVNPEDDHVDWGWVGAGDDDAPLPPPVTPAPPPRAAQQPPRAEPAPTAQPAGAGAGSASPPSSLEDRLAALEGLPAAIENLGKAIRHELERCAGVLFSHDRALGALAARVDAVEAGPARPDAVRASDEAVAGMLEQVRRFDERLVAMETRVEPLEPLPAVVAALRRAVRASDDLLAAETTAREQALAALAGQQATEAQSRDDALRRLLAQDLDRVSGISSAQAKGLADLAERVAGAENRLAPLASVPDDIAALSRIMRRELDAIVTDNQARDQMLRRALQNEIDTLRSSSEERSLAAEGLSSRLDALESRSTEMAVATEAALSSAGGRLESVESRLSAVDRITAELGALSETVTRELEHLRAGGQAHDQVAGELTRRLSALDARLARLDPVPGEVQSLRTAMLQEAERTVSALRATDERIGQLAWVPGEFQEARKRIMAVTSGVQTGQDRIRQLEASLASLNERLDALRARVGATVPPGPPA
jgi:chromosome segregation ATPase